MKVPKGEVSGLGGRQAIVVQFAHQINYERKHRNLLPRENKEICIDFKNTSTILPNFYGWGYMSVLFNLDDVCTWLQGGHTCTWATQE